MYESSYIIGARMLYVKQEYVIKFFCLSWLLQLCYNTVQIKQQVINTVRQKMYFTFDHVHSEQSQLLWLWSRRWWCSIRCEAWIESHPTFNTNSIFWNTWKRTLCTLLPIRRGMVATYIMNTFLVLSHFFHTILNILCKIFNKVQKIAGLHYQ